MDTAWNIILDSDEAGWYISIENDSGQTNLRCGSDVLKGLDESLQSYRDWTCEGEAERHHPPLGVLEDEMREAYDPSDPKHPDFLERADTIRDRMRDK